jgi:type III secretory pathway lipoprotein EscJ
LTSREEVDRYLDGIRQKLYGVLEEMDGVQIN